MMRGICLDLANDMYEGGAVQECIQIKEQMSRRIVFVNGFVLSRSWINCYGMTKSTID